MTVAELIEELKDMPQDADVYVEGEKADKVCLEGYDANGNHKKGWAKVVRIIKAWDIDMVCPAKELAERK